MKKSNKVLDSAEEKGWSWLRACPRMVASEKCFVVCRMYFEGCKKMSLFLSVLSFLPSFFLDFTISLSLPPDCIRIDCSLSKWFYSIFLPKQICTDCISCWCALLHPPAHNWHFFNIYVLNVHDCHLPSRTRTHFLFELLNINSEKDSLTTSCRMFPFSMCCWASTPLGCTQVPLDLKRLTVIPPKKKS